MTKKNVPSRSKIEKALGIGEKLANIETSEAPKDEENKERFINRQKLAKKLHEQLETKKKLESEITTEDEVFLKERLRSFIQVAETAAQLLQQELETTGDYKVAESLGSVVNSGVAAVDKFASMNNDKKKFQLEERKLAARETASPNLTQNNNITAFVGSTADLLKALKDQTKEATVEKIETDKE